MTRTPLLGVSSTFPTKPTLRNTMDNHSIREGKVTGLAAASQCFKYFN
ncbi:hypothetical protein OIO11_12210 [Clostridium sp. ZS2-4]|nr:hypothetical protein [Clostridium sp. ZS2-4]